MPEVQGTLGGTSARRRVGATERAAQRTVKRWRDDGYPLTELDRAELYGAARDVDAATEDYRDRDGSVFTITRARALLADIHDRVRPAADRQRADEDPLADVVAAIEAAGAA